MNKQKIIKFLKETEFDVQSARACLFACDLYFDSYANSKIIKNAGISPVFCYIKVFDSRNPFYQIIGKKALFELMDKALSRYLKNPEKIITLMNKITEYSNSLEKIGKYVIKNENNLSDKDLLIVFDKMIKISKVWCMHSTFGEDKGQFVNEEIKKFLVEKYKIEKNKAQEMIGIITHPKEISALNQERKDFLNIVFYIKKKGLTKELTHDKKIASMLDNYLARNFWIKTDFYRAIKIDKDLLFKEAVKEAKNMKFSNIAVELKNTDKNLSEILKRKKIILSKLNLSEREKKIIKFAEFLVFWQDSRKFEMMKQFYYLFMLIEAISKRFAISYDRLAGCSTQELREVLINKKAESKKSKMYFIVFEKNQQPKYYSGEIAKKMFDYASKLESKGLKELKGSMASSGKAKYIKGIARIITNPLKQKFNKGEILVTSMTRVEFIPVMRKAKAIITNEGGISCHAAIVSRELGIPCIVGTKIATRFLKDGDPVEIDMKNGIVKVLE